MSNSDPNERFALARAIPLAIRRAIARAIAPTFFKKLEDCGARSKRLDEKWEDLCARGARLGEKQKDIGARLPEARYSWGVRKELEAELDALEAEGAAFTAELDAAEAERTALKAEFDRLRGNARQPA
jgi:septal ring factor EnvC (AmiA/AmiB activator)